MPDVKISQLPATTGLDGTELVPVVDGVVTMRATATEVATPAINAHKADPAAHTGTYARYNELALLLDSIITGAITRDANGAATGAPVIWPDGSPGTYTATTVSPAFPGAVDAYTVTYGSPVTRTYTQPAVTRDATGAVTVRPALVVT